jgi:hypothetical protein
MPRRNLLEIDGDQLRTNDRAIQNWIKRKPFNFLQEFLPQSLLLLKMLMVVVVMTMMIIMMMMMMILKL